jgi:hypothetical protein
VRACVQPKVAVVPTLEDEFFGGNTSAVLVAFVRSSDGAFETRVYFPTFYSLV